MILSEGDRVTLRATPLDQTSIQTGGRRRELAKSRLARRSHHHRLTHGGHARRPPGGKVKADQTERRRKTSLFRRLSSKRASAEIQQVPLICLFFDFVCFICLCVCVCVFCRVSLIQQIRLKVLRFESLHPFVDWSLVDFDSSSFEALLCPFQILDSMLWRFSCLPQGSVPFLIDARQPINSPVT